MDLALRLARRGLGTVAPNPAVGCVVVATDGPVSGYNNSHIIGRGWTRAGGRPHAETQALDQAKTLYGSEAIKGTCVYVTLEPCSHKGKTPPCAAALVEARIGRLVVAVRDPDPRVSGRGLEIASKAGIQVSEGVARAAAERLNEGFFRRIADRRPMVTWKTATSLDGRIATRARDSQWITGAAARRRAHLMRAEHDAVMVGAETAILDNPQLTCRLPGLEAFARPRIVIDTRLRLPLTSELVIGARNTPTIVVCVSGGDRARRKAYEQAGVTLVDADKDGQGRVDLTDALIRLGELGITRALVEGGAELVAGLMRADLIDRIAWFRSPAMIGGDGLPATGPLGVDAVDLARRWLLVDAVRYGDDILETYDRMA
ncbi:MAG: bifunctional diaminohydroxyphosphoribosylaminopyrimidine deaminase/5-amino-6-(5-phosphoribosylamino)uracil reductase RibD [Alphaproteobacteria bacterium]|nr:bifunctional diaminohydroxyphosphoribosylaminopyrimidine deaminase/5-amino-6-(5-phosphoribosylamino)uracil reductase RibD [Alphaproteobacteria bacterium]